MIHKACLWFAIPLLLLNTFFLKGPKSILPRNLAEGASQHNSVGFQVKSLQQSNIYEVNIRQYTREGTFRAFQTALPRLKQMGVEILWFMPVTPISKIDRKGTLGSYYAVQDYKSINPEFGTMEDFKELVDYAHRLGFMVITDWVANHTGADHQWLSSHTDFYNRDSLGKAVSAFDWTDTRDLNYDNHEMRDSMIAAMKFWLVETGIDGFRCDVAGEVPDDFWKECIMELKKVKDVFMLAEGDKGSLHEDGFDATYAWDMFQCMKNIASGKTTALAIDSVLKRQEKTFPPHSMKLYFTSNHDENSWNSSDYGTFPGNSHAPFAVLTQTLVHSLPLIYSGQEEPVLRKIEFFEKDDMQFSKFARAGFYKTLLTLRKNTPALAADAGFIKLNTGNDKAVYAYLREKNGSKVAVILNLTNMPQLCSITDDQFVGSPQNVFTSKKEQVSGKKTFQLKPWQYIVYRY